MQVTRVRVANYRNYELCELALTPGRNIFVGENAQGKTNLLEAIELLSTGKSTRANQDLELIRWGSQVMIAELDFTSRGSGQSLRIALSNAPAERGIAPKSTRLEKQVSVNGVHQKGTADLLGRLLVVSFNSNDLNLLRGGPKYRRDWLDSLILKLKPAVQEYFVNYRKSVAQRNRLLRSIFEHGKVTVTDQDQLLVWDKQVSRFGARIIKQRLHVLSQLLPLAEEHQSRISREQEALTIKYMFKAADTEQNFSDDESSEETPGSAESVSTGPLNAVQLAAMEEVDIATTLMKLLKEKRFEEIRRKQTLLGPHRDDLTFFLNGADAGSFASQGQQRSIVLSLKLAELSLIKQVVDECPVLLLDDVLAELDEFRQGLLMSVVESNTQTVITTTHITGFDPRWLEAASIFQVQGGNVTGTSSNRFETTSAG